MKPITFGLAAVLACAGSAAWGQDAAREKPQKVSPAAGKRTKSHRGKAGIEWVTIPGGSFMMGADDLGLESKPRHQVTVKTFQMAKTLVTNKQYKVCVRAGACTAPKDIGESFKGDDQPVVGVDWDQAKAFSEWAGGRLPSEAEWEYAARSAGKDYKYPWGDEAPTCERSAGACGSEAAHAPVCSKPKGNTEQGLCDMAGNALEWAQDWYHDSYNGAPNDGSAWENPRGSIRVYRGGSLYFGAGIARAAYRDDGGPARRVSDFGVRPAR